MIKGWVGWILVKHVSRRSPDPNMHLWSMKWRCQSIPHNRPWFHRTSYIYLCIWMYMRARPDWYKKRQQYKSKSKDRNTTTKAITTTQIQVQVHKRRAACLTCFFSGRFFFLLLLQNLHILFPLPSAFLVSRFDVWPPFKISPAAQNGESRGGRLIDWLTAAGKWLRASTTPLSPWLGKHVAE